MSGKVKFNINKTLFTDFIIKLEKLKKINDVVRIKIDDDKVLLYSLLPNGNSVLALKSYELETNQLLEIDNVNNNYDIVIINLGKFIKNLKLLSTNDKITLELSYKEKDNGVLSTRYLNVTGGKIKIKWVTGEDYDIKDISREILNKTLNIKNRKWSFTIEENDLKDVKKLSTINEDRLVNISTSNGIVKMSEKNTWDLEVCRIDNNINKELLLNKKFLNSINDKEDIEFSIFENFMYIKDDESKLMLSFEQDFDDDDEPY